MFMWVCAHCLLVRMYKYGLVGMDVNEYVCTNMHSMWELVCVCACTLVCASACMGVYLGVCMCVGVGVRVYACVRVCGGNYLKNWVAAIVLSIFLAKKYPSMT